MRDRAATEQRKRCSCAHAALEARQPWRRWECHLHGSGLRMRAVSLTNPYPYFIFDLPPEHRKDIENRPRSITSALGPLLLCSTASATETQWEVACGVARAAGVPEALLPAYGTLPSMGLVGAVTVSEVLPKVSLFDRQHRWKFPGFVGYVLSRRAALPFRSMPGDQGIFHVDLTEVEERTLVTAGIVL